MSLDQSFGFLLNNAARKISFLVSLHFQPYGVTTEQWVVLNRLAEGDGITQKELALRAGKDQTNVTRILDQLERKELIIRRSNKEDRRSLLAFVTPKGKALNEQLIPVEQDIMKRVLTGLPEEEINQLKTLLASVTSYANEYIKQMEEPS